MILLFTLDATPIRVSFRVVHQRNWRFYSIHDPFTAQKKVIYSILVSSRLDNYTPPRMEGSQDSVEGTSFQCGQPACEPEDEDGFSTPTPEKLIPSPSKRNCPSPPARLKRSAMSQLDCVASSGKPADESSEANPAKKKRAEVTVRTWGGMMEFDAPSADAVCDPAFKERLSQGQQLEDDYLSFAAHARLTISKIKPSDVSTAFKNLSTVLENFLKN